jgi:glycine cleavage system transcriptional repressor
MKGMAMSDKYLVISALGRDRPGIVNTLSKAALDCGCNITNSRMAVLGGEFALILLINGPEEAVAAMQKQLPSLEEQLQLTVIAKTTAPRAAEQRWIPYRVEVVAMDHPGIVHPITEFFSTQKINIEELETETYAAPHTGATMFALQMTVAVPHTIPISQLRETFIDFCDDLNLDASFEAARD